jgi:hypothetical protein
MAPRPAPKTEPEEFREALEIYTMSEQTIEDFMSLMDSLGDLDEYPERIQSTCLLKVLKIAMNSEYADVVKNSDGARDMIDELNSILEERKFRTLHFRARKILDWLEN